MGGAPHPPGADPNAAGKRLREGRGAVEVAGADFGEEAFPIIRALMYLDGLVIRTHPDVKLIRSMSPYLEEFRTSLPIPEPEQNQVRTAEL